MIKKGVRVEMDNNVVTILNAIPLGYALLILIALVGGTAWITKTVSKFLDKHRKMVLKEQNESETRDEMLSSLSKLQDSVSNIQKDVDKFNENSIKNAEENRERLSALEQKFDTFKQSSDEKDEELMKNINELEQTVDKISGQVHILIGSEKEAIEIYISNEYHKWMEREEIDIFALETVERRLTQYKRDHPDENWVEQLVIELRELPKRHIVDSLD